MSMMAHKIRVVPFSTFRLNVYVTTPYNADFDGDEMNMHVPQSYQTREELKAITLVPTQIISPSNCKPIITIIQDSLIGAYLLTQDYVRLSKEKINNLMMFNDNYTGDLPEPFEIKNGIELWTGRQVFSLILPNISLKLKIKMTNQ